MKRQVSVVCCVAALLAACSQGGTRQQLTPEADKAAIRHMASALTAAEERGDLNGFMSFHTDESIDQ